MERDIDMGREREMDNLEILMEPYGLFMEKNWEAVKKYYTEKDSAYLDSSLTVARDTALHIAVFSKNKKLLEFLIKHGRWRGEERAGGWNIWGNTPLHEVAATGDKEMARILLKFDKSQLGQKNNYGETPLFRAAAFGRKEMVKFLVRNVIEDINRESSIIEKHRWRKDSTSILHIAILGIHFDTALELLTWDFSLRDLRDEHGRACFQLQANMPSAFKSGHPMSVLEGLLYLCLPDDDGLHDDKYNEFVEEQILSLAVAGVLVPPILLLKPLFSGPNPYYVYAGDTLLLREDDVDALES